MKLKDKIKSYSFWVSFASAVILILKVLGNRFGFTVDEGMVSDLFTALCSILVLLGIIVVPTVTNASSLSNNQVLQETQKKLMNNDVEITEPNHSADEKQIEKPIQIAETINTQNLESKNEIILEKHPDESNTESYASTQDEPLKLEPEIEPATESVDKLFVDDVVDTKDITETQCIVYEQSEDKPETTNVENLTDIPEVTPINDFASLKEMFNNERIKFAKNMNEYIFELQEEIRKAREQM